MQDWKIHTMAQKVLHAVFDDPEGTVRSVADMLGCGTVGVEQTEVLRDKSIIEEKLKKEQGRYETLLDMRMNNEIPREVSSWGSPPCRRTGNFRKRRWIDMCQG